MSQFTTIVSLHPLTSELAKGALDSEDYSKIINVCPDEVGALSAAFYFCEGVINTVNSEETHKVFHAHATDYTKIIYCGHPMDPAILKNRTDIFNRIKDDLNYNRIKIGLYIGGFGPESQKVSLLKTISELSNLIKSGSVEVYILTGGHKDYEKRLEKVIDEFNLHNLNNLHIIYTKDKYELVRKGHDLIRNNINIMFSRPSELVFYSLCTGIPHVTFPPLGPQELDMYQLLLNHAPVKKFTDIEGTFEKFVQDAQQLTLISEGLYNSGYNMNGVENLCKLLK